MPQSLATSSLSRRTGRGGPSSQNPANRRSVRVVMLDRIEVVVQVENKSARIVDIFNQICQRVNLNETQYFGLASLNGGEFQFLANDTKLHKLAPKVWKSKDCVVDEPLITFYFRVQFYVDNISLLKERSTRLQYYLQLRDNLLHYSQSVTEEKCFMLAGYALQAEYGNFNNDKHRGDYFDPREFFPAWVVMRRGQDYITNHMPTIHRDLSGMPHAEACLQYIREVSVPPTQHNMHFYRLRRRKYDPNPGNVWLAICPKGLEVYEEVNDFKSHYSTFLWPHIGKLSCEKKKFEIVAEGFAERRFVYYTSSEESGKLLWHFCRATHQFHLAQQPRVLELCRLQERDIRGPHQEMYVYSENSMLSHDKRSISDRSRASSIPASGARDRPGSGQSAIHSPGVRGASSPPESSRYYGDTTGNSGRDVDNEIMIVSPPQPSSSQLSSSSSFTKVTPLSGDLQRSMLWTPPSHFITNGQRALSESSEQKPALSTSSSIVSLKPPSVVGRGSFIRSSASSTDGSVKLANGGRVPFLLPMTNVTEDLYNSPANVGLQRSGRTASSRRSCVVVNAASLQRNLRPGENLNDTVDKILEGDPTALRSVPPRKSSLIYPRTGALQSSDLSVMRSTSLRQPATAKTNESDVWPPLQRLLAAPAQSNLNLAAPVPVDAQIHRIPFASPMTVMSNPVQSNTAIQPPGSGSSLHTPPYHVSSDYRHSTPNEAASLFVVGPLHSTPIQRPLYQHPGVNPSSASLLSHIAGENNSESAQLSDSTDNGIATDPIGNSTAANLYPPGLSVIYGNGMQQQVNPTADPAKQSYVDDVRVTKNTPGHKQPPSYEMSQTYRLTAALATPPTNHRYGLNNGIAARVQHFVTESSNIPSSNVVNAFEAATQETAPVYYPNGIAMANGSAGAHLPPTLVHPLNGYAESSVGLSKATSSIAAGQPPNPVHQCQTQTATSPLHRQTSDGSVDSDDSSARCPQHGSGRDLVQMVRNIDSPLPFLKALCNDRTLLNSCTCRPPQQSTNNHEVIGPASNNLMARRFSLSQSPLSWNHQYDQPGTVVRPNSWGSDLQASQLCGMHITYDIDIDGGPVDSPRHFYANGVAFADGNSRGRGLVYRHSDGSSFQHAALNRLGQNHSEAVKLPPSYIAA